VVKPGGRAADGSPGSRLATTSSRMNCAPRQGLRQCSSCLVPAAPLLAGCWVEVLVIPCGPKRRQRAPQLSDAAKRKGLRLSLEGRCRFGPRCQIWWSGAGHWSICQGRRSTGGRAVGFFGRSPGNGRGQSGGPACYYYSACREWPTGVGGSLGQPPRRLSGTGSPGRRSRNPQPFEQSLGGPFEQSLGGVRVGQSPVAAPAGTGWPGRQR